MNQKRSVGKPRVHDRDKVFADIVEWAKQPDSINLCKFCATYEPSIAPSMILLWARENPEYRLAYEIAKTFIGFRREEKLNRNELHVKAYDLNASTYDFFLKDEKRNDAEFNANLSKDIKNNLDAEDKARYEQLITQLSNYQAKRILNNLTEEKQNNDG